jgi:tryptophanyl-tRNA synthetase
MRQHLQLQAAHEGFYFIADYHSLTSNPSPEEVAQYSLDVTMDYLALGLDTDKTVFWRHCVDSLVRDPDGPFAAVHQL